MGLAIRGLEVAIQGKRILRDVSFEVADGEFVSLLGASGAGKTTTLKAVSGILYPDAGSIEIDGQPVNDVPAYRRGTSVVFQDIRLFPNMTVEQNVAFPLKMQQVSRKERVARTRELLKLMHLEGLGQRGVDEISGGQQQRVALARALAAEPRVLLLDEPFSGLDERLRNEMYDLVVGLHHELGLTTLLVTHDATEALMASDHIVYMLDGEVIQYGTPADLYEHPMTSEVATSFGDCTVLEGTIEEGTFHQNRLRLPCPSICAAASTADGPATAVIRHGGVQLVPDGTLEVINSTYRGDTYLVRIDTGASALIARSPTSFEPRERVDIRIAEGSMFVYPDGAKARAHAPS